MATVSTPSGPDSVLDDGRAALARGAWGDAVAALERVVSVLPAADPRCAEAWQGIGLASYWRDDGARAVAAHEHAFAAYLDLGQPALAARMALWLADDHMAFHGAAAAANGWVERAERLLQGVPESEHHAWLLVYRAHYHLQVEFDTDRAIALTREALACARAHHAADAEVVALALEGLTLVVQGDVATGMPLLDEASAAALTRDLSDLNAVAWALCALLQGCDTVRDFDRATEWCERVLAFCERWGLGPVFTSCRTRYASVLTWQGRWQTAEWQIQQLLGTGVERPAGARRAALARLGDVRRRQGRFDEAESLFDKAGEHRLAILGRASVALARDNCEVATDLADRVLRLLPRAASAERTDALLIRILAAARRGETAPVVDDLAELAATAARLATPALRGAAALAIGAVRAAERDPAAALAAYEDALVHYDRGGAPHEAAIVRLELAVVLRALGREATARREATAAREVLARLGAAADCERADRFLGEPRADRAAARAGGSTLPLTTRELEVLRLVGAGFANPEIARRLRLSPHTVKRHLANILRKLDTPSRAAAVAKASRLGAL